MSLLSPANNMESWAIRTERCRAMWEMNAIDRRYSVPPSTLSDPSGRYRTTEDLHAWSIYRQNLNSDFTDSALGTSEKSQPPFGNFQLRESTVHTILNHPKYGPRERSSELGQNIYTYLRFGLPRVFPQTGRPPRDTSSGYDSSDDGSPFSNRRRVRSDPDFRNHVIGPVAETSLGVMPLDRQRRLKASSEADLLGHHLAPSWEPKHYHKGTPSALGNGNHPPPPPPSERRSRAGSHISVNSRGQQNLRTAPDGFHGHEGPLLNDKYFPKDSFYSSLPTGDGEPIPGVFKHPHLQVRDLFFELDLSSTWKHLCGGARTKLRLLEGLSFEVRGGEILAVMATSEEEGTTLLDILANKHRKWRSRLRGEILVNGLYTPPAKLGQCLSYVQRGSEFIPDMSVRQTLLFATLLQESGSAKDVDTKGRINALLEDLGLGQVKHTRVRDLTDSEKRRLNVACHLLLDTDIVLLDQPTKGMDIFDTFFLMEYLRQWAARGRIIVVTIHPPTYEIFTMISRVALISTGRMLYHGKRRDMLPYFAYIDFPCPAYKNPSDYYLDLVTLDNLSAEALLESSQRVENLVEIFRRRQEALTDPGPPGTPPPAIKKSNLCSQIFALWIRTMIYMFPFNFVGFCGDVFLVALMSVLLGAVYWNVRVGFEQEHVTDRFGLYYTLMALAIWPFLLRTVSQAWEEKPPVTRDIGEGLYTKGAYLLAKLTSSFLTSSGVIVAYAVPVYSMAGLESHERVRSFAVYIGYMLLYVQTLRLLAMAASWLCPERHMSAALTGFILTFVASTAGYAVHLRDLSPVFSWFQWLSPMRWILEELLNWEFGHLPPVDGGKYVCSRNPVVQQEIAILVRAECGIKTDSDAIHFFYGYDSKWPTYQPIVITVAFALVFAIVGIFAFFIRPQQKARRNNTADNRT